MNIGVFDSGVGGLWILKHLVEGIPGCNFIFLGDMLRRIMGFILPKN